MMIDEKFEELLKLLMSDDDKIKLEGDEEELRDKYLMLGYCPDCHVGLEPYYPTNYMRVCPKCGKWYNRDRLCL